MQTKAGSTHCFSRRAIKAGAFRPYDTQSEAEDVWANVVGPFQKMHGVELGSHIYQVGVSFVFGPVYSSGNKSAILGFWDVKPLSRGARVGFIHTHPNSPFFSGMDYAENYEGNSVARGWNYDGDLMAAADQRIDAAMVHNGKVYRWDYQSFEKAKSYTSGYVRAGDLVK